MSDHSDQAIRQAFDIAKIYNAEVFVLHVINDPVQLCTVDYCISEELFVRLQAEMLESARSGIWRQLAKFQSMGVASVTAEVKVGVPHDVILKQAEERKVDLIVISSHGSTSLSKYLMGGVARHVLMEAKCNVLLVK
jgi:nucleotide-binding universal stress UspA family protein